MIVKESFNEKIVKHYSDQHLKIKQVETGEVYDEAYDLKPCKYSYVETEEKIEENEEEVGYGMD